MTNQTINNDVTLTGGENPLLVGRYQVVRQLGTGGMGSVWLAEDRQLDNKLFAVKMLPSILVANKRAYRQLKDEALVAMKLVHPNIVQIRAFEENNGNPFLVMDYIEGQTLDDYLADKGKLTEDETVRLLKPIATALDYAHGQGVIHRDVKPANVMIRRNDGQTFILDFGIAREIQETMTRVTGKLSSGTLLYMSPEQLRGQPPNAAQDVYSFAAMVYECLKGEPPFSRGQIEYQILNEQPERLSDDIRISASIMRGLSKTPEARPDSCVKVLLTPCPIRQMPAARPQVSVSPRLVAPMTDRIVVRPKRSIARLVVPIICLVIVILAVGEVLWHRQVQQQETARKLAIEQQHNELLRQQAEDKRRSQEDAERKKLEAERIAKEHEEAEARRKAEDAKQREEEAKARERELARQKEEEGRKTAEAATAALEKAVAEANSQRQLAVSAYKAAVKAKAKEYAPDKFAAANVLWTKAKNVAEKAQTLEEFQKVASLFGTAENAYKTCANLARCKQSELDSAKANLDCQHTEQKIKAGESFMIDKPHSLDLTMKWCPVGFFKMGSPATGNNRQQDELEHIVFITNGFWLGETEITQGQWRKVMDDETVITLAQKALDDNRLHVPAPVYGPNAGRMLTLREFWGLENTTDPSSRCGDIDDNAPVYHVSWYQAMEFCRRLTEQERLLNRIPDGYEYRLPTEEEWEYACKAISFDTREEAEKTYYKFSDLNLKDVAWFAGNSYVGFYGRGMPVAIKNGSLRLMPNSLITSDTGQRAWCRIVKSKKPNKWGFYDMLGNVNEWCMDFYNEYSDSQEEMDAEYRVYRGGCWGTVANECRPARRFKSWPFLPVSTIGFRVALAPIYTRDTPKTRFLTREVSNPSSISDTQSAVVDKIVAEISLKIDSDDVIAAQNILEDYESRVLSSNESSSSLLHCHYLVAEMFWEKAQAEYSKTKRNDDEIKDLLFGSMDKSTKKRKGKGAFNLASNIFFSHPDHPQALKAGVIVEAIKNFSEKNYGAKILTKNIEYQRQRIRSLR